jgi:hypothetical protein
LAEIEKSIKEFVKTASEKEKKQLKLLLEHSTGKISTQEYFKKSNALGWDTHDFYTACILAVLTKSVVSLEKKLTGIESKLEKQAGFSGEKKA